MQGAEPAGPPGSDDQSQRTLRTTLIRDLVRGRRVIHMPADTTIQQACKIMTMLEMGALPVVDDGKLVGIFTERDCIAVLAQARDPAAATLSDVMTKKVCTIGLAAKAADAMELMCDGGFRHLPVLQDDEVIGIVSMRDLLSMV